MVPVSCAASRLFHRFIRFLGDGGHARHWQGTIWGPEACWDSFRVHWCCADPEVLAVANPFLDLEWFKGAIGVPVLVAVLVDARWPLDAGPPHHEGCEPASDIPHAVPLRKIVSLQKFRFRGLLVGELGCAEQRVILG